MNKIESEIFHFEEVQLSLQRKSMLKFLWLTRGPMGHILDTAIRCFRAIRVQLPNKDEFAKLKPSLEKYGALLDHNDRGTIQRFLPGAI